MESFSFIIPGTVGLKITMTEQDDGSLLFDLVNEGEMVADLRGLFFDTVDAGILSTLSIKGAQVTGTAIGDDAVSNLGGGVNMNGVGAFDLGVAFGSAGIGKDDIGATSLTLSSSDGPLDLDDFAGVDFGVRFTSVGEVDGARDGSLKIFGSSPDTSYEWGGLLPPVHGHEPVDIGPIYVIGG